MPTKKVTVHYRRLVDRNLRDVDLMPHFGAGLDGLVGGVRLRDADSARITTSADGHRMCLLSPGEGRDWCFGEIAVFREGDVPVAEMDPAGPVRLRTIPLAGNEEAVRGSTYFMARGPHFAIINHDSSTRFLEDYLRWLLRLPLGDLPQDELLSLHPLIYVDGVAVAVREVRSLKIRAQVEREDDAGHVRAARPQTFARMIDRQQLTGANLRTVLHAMGLTNGSLQRLSDGDLADLEFELLVRKKEHNRIQPLPDDLVQSVFNDGLDRAAELGTLGARRRGDAVVASHPSSVEVEGAYYDLESVRAALWAALGEWRNQALI